MAQPIVIPATTFLFPEAMDPADLVDFEIDCAGLLTVGENVASYTVTLRPESILLGLTLGVSEYATIITGSVIRIYLSISSGSQSDPTFINGAYLPFEVSIVTDDTPARKRQRTVAVKVIQQ